MTANVKIVAVLTARADTVDRLRALLDAMLKPSRAEPGNLRYDLWQDQSDPNRFVMPRNSSFIRVTLSREAGHEKRAGRFAGRRNAPLSCSWITWASWAR